jgi:hypothetical protein
MTSAIRYLSLLVAMLAPAAVLAQSAPSITIADYPRHGTAPSPVQLDQLRRVAMGIAGTLLTGADVNVSIVGHADFDAQGRAFETEVSRERARGAEASLTALVLQEAARVGLPVARAQSVHYTAVGLGTARPVFPSPSNEDERKGNRRVEILVGVTAPQPPVAEPLFQRCTRVLAGSAPPGPVRRMTCACDKFLVQQPRVQDSHYDFRAQSAIPGSAGLPNLTPELLDVAIRGMVRHLRQDIGSSGNGFSDQDFARNLLTLDDTVGRNINDFSSQQNAGDATGLFHRLIIADIQTRMADPNHVYSCYAGYSRTTHDR